MERKSDKGPGGAADLAAGRTAAGRARDVCGHPSVDCVTDTSILPEAHAAAFVNNGVHLRKAADLNSLQRK